MVRFLSRHELENLYYMYERYEETYHTLQQSKQEQIPQDLQMQIDEQMKIVKKQQRQMLSSLT
ncbi:hypothetical protein [Oceanobacillus neutriphilus]|uniref:Uncharacterized protein n=1 Tax=Oceanobacillus neutriphilus TaxID=531815 RepID=A0ABQ2NZD0_9BACI|nr:hypothetical protein [Oceanobacillus neutriphilus]GGP14346.1 hypothetical protein GCM10011346_37940 [Oceanobacillus neutriphilus]